MEAVFETVLLPVPNVGGELNCALNVLKIIILAAEFSKIATLSLERADAVPTKIDVA